MTNKMMRVLSCIDQIKYELVVTALADYQSRYEFFVTAQAIIQTAVISLIFMSGLNHKEHKEAYQILADMRTDLYTWYFNHDA